MKIHTPRLPKHPCRVRMSRLDWFSAVVFATMLACLACPYLIGQGAELAGLQSVSEALK